MTAKKMPRPKLEAHGTKFRYRVRVPKELAQHFPKKILVKTFDGPIASAEVACLAWEAELRAKFHGLRTTGKLPDLPIPPRHGLPLTEPGAVLQEELERYKAERLAADESWPRVAPVAGERTVEQRLAVLGIDEHAAQEAEESQSSYLLDPYIARARQRLRAVGVELREEFAVSAGAAFAHADLEIADMIRRRAGRELVSVPSPQPRKHLAGLSAPVAGLHRLADALPIWQAYKKPAPATVEVYEGAAALFASLYPDLYAETIQTEHVRGFIEKRMEAGKSAKTIEKEHGAIRALLSFAVKQGWRADNPASNASLPSDKGAKKRRSMTKDELAQVFASPIFTRGLRMVGGKGEAGFWLPLLALFTGARREELAQLTAERVRVEEGVPYLAIDPIDDDGSLKTDESRRAVPIHSELIRLGFLAFVEDRRRAGGGHLFPLLKPNKRGQYAAKWGDWWGREFRKAGVKDATVAPMHSFRHGFITELRRLRVREDEERLITGHSVKMGKRDAHDGYGEHFVPGLAEVVNRVDFRGLDLSAVTPYKAARKAAE